MKGLIVMQGVPGSGKSTRAKEIMVEKRFNGRVIRMNRDTMREMLHFGEWSRRNEKDVISAEINLVRHFLDLEFTVIIDDTNLSPGTIGMWEEIAAEHDMEPVMVMMDTPIEECIRRDANRERTVGESVIRRFEEAKAALTERISK